MIRTVQPESIRFWLGLDLEAAGVERERVAEDEDGQITRAAKDAQPCSPARLGERRGRASSGD